MRPLTLPRLRCQCLCACLALTLASQTFICGQPIPATIPPGTLFHDFDHDGIQEKLISSPGHERDPALGCREQDVAERRITRCPAEFGSWTIRARMQDFGLST